MWIWNYAVYFQTDRIQAWPSIRQDVLLTGYAQQVPAGAHQVILDPNGQFGLSQDVEVAGEQMTVRQITVFKDNRDRQVAVHQNVMGLRREDAGSQGNDNEGPNNNQENHQEIPIGAADSVEGNDHNDEDLRQAIPNAERVLARLPAPATFLAQLYGPYPPRRWANSRPNYTPVFIQLLLSNLLPRAFCVKP